MNVKKMDIYVYRSLRLNSSAFLHSNYVDLQTCNSNWTLHQKSLSNRAMAREVTEGEERKVSVPQTQKKKPLRVLCVQLNGEQPMRRDLQSFYGRAGYSFCYMYINIINITLQIVYIHWFIYLLNVFPLSHTYTELGKFLNTKIYFDLSTFQPVQ